MAKRGNPGTPYTPGVDGGGTKPSRGNPGTPYTPPYKKDEKPTTESRGTPYTPGVNGGGTGSGSTAPTPAPTPQPSTSSSSSDDEHKQQNQNPFFNPGFQQQQQSQTQQQQQANNTFINSLDTVRNALGTSSSSDIKQNVELAQKFNVASNPRISSTRPYSTPNFNYKEIQKNLQAQQQDTNIKAADLSEYTDKTYWSKDRKVDVSYATSIDYYNMERRGYETVYVEDGNEALQDKGGVYTIGRDRLAGLPNSVKTVLVDNAGNWKYLVDTSNRAEHIEALTNKRDAVNSTYDYEISKELSFNKKVTEQAEWLKNKITEYERIANKTKDPEDIERLQAAINAYSSYRTIIDRSYDNLSELSTKWAREYEFYDIAINAHTKWTVQEEEDYQNLKNQLLAGTNDTAKISQYIAMNRRREANKNAAVLLSTDSISALKDREAAMAKAVDDYNKWDSVTLHLENGEDLGTQLKRFLITAITDRHSDNLFTEESKARREANFKGLGKAISNQFTPIGKAYSEYKKAANAYYETQQQIGELLNSSEYKQDELDNLYAKSNEYLKASEYAIDQGKAIMLNNVVANLSVFDTMSIQSTFVAWRMAKHPDRYDNDPKWQKLKDAYKAIYGTDFNGAMDAGKMAQAMLEMKLGLGKADGDYIYLDGSDLRYASGKKYGLAASIAVGMLTDISAVAGLAKAAAGSATSRMGARAITESATDTYIQGLVRAGVSEDVAKEFVTSKTVQKALRKDIRKSIKQTIRDGSDDLINTVNSTITKRAEVLESFATEDFKRLISKTHYDDFLARAESLVASSTDINKTILQVEKGTVLTHALGTLDDVLNGVQSALFKATCPVAGAVVGVAKIGNAIKAAKNLNLANESNLFRPLETAMQYKAKIDGLSFSSALDTVNFQHQWTELMDEWSYGVMGAIRNNAPELFSARPDVYEKTYEEIIKPFSDYNDYLMRETANSYVYHIVNKLDDALNVHTVTLAEDAVTKDAFSGLTELAQEYGYETFDEMFTVLKNNIEVIYDASPDARHIVEAFENKYKDAVLKKTVSDIHKYVETTGSHLDYIKKVFNVDGRTSILSNVNAKLYPEFVQGNAKAAWSNIYDFLQTVNNDYTTYVDTLGNTYSIHETAKKLMDTLLDVYHGDLSDIKLLRARLMLSKYVDEVNGIYFKQLKDWEANVVQDAIGVQNYFDTIQKIVPDHAGNTETLNRIADSMQHYFEEKGVKITTQELFDKVIQENINDIFKLTQEQQNAFFYRVMASKSSDMIKEVTDSNLKTLTDGLTDCNSQLNKNLRILQMNFAEGTVSHSQINDAIRNAVAVGNTRELYNYLKASNVDNTLQMTIMDVLAGHSNRINSILQYYPPETAATKLTDYIIDEAKKQLALHNGNYSLYTQLNCNTADVGANVLNIEKALSEGEYAKLFEEDENCIDVCISMVRSNDNAAPKDVAFHVRGSEEAPTILRKNGKFTVYDDGFARRAYGATAQSLNDGYAALGDVATLSDDEWIRQFQDYINTVKEKALSENKTIRFIGFNTSDAVGGGNRYVSDVLRSAGVNANTANAIDFADVIRAADGQYVFNPADINALTRGLRTVADSAEAKSITLGISNVLAYDPKYTCADMLNNALKNVKFDNAAFDAQVKYILENTETISKGLGTEAYDDFGLALGTYINATAFSKLLDDAGISTMHANSDLMKIVANATVAGEPELNIHKIIEDAIDNRWIDQSKFTGAFTIKDFESKERIHQAILQINRINEDIHRVDLITDADVPGLKTIFKDALHKSGTYYHNSAVYQIAQAIKVDDLSAQELYAATKWLLDNTQRIMDEKKYAKMFSIMLATNRVQATKLTDMGYTFLRDNIVDYTNDSLEAFLYKYLDTSEEGYKFSQALSELAELRDSRQNLKNYMDSVEGLFNKYDVHGVQDRMILYQLADVHKPIIALQDEIQNMYDSAYTRIMQELYADAKLYGENAKYDFDMLDRIATERAVKTVKERIAARGTELRNNSVKVVTELNADAFRAHLIRNCCGGIIIDPNSSVMKGVDLNTLFEQWRGYGVTIDAVNFSKGNIKNKKLFRVYIDDLGEKSADEIFAKYNNTFIEFNNPLTSRFSKTGVKKFGNVTQATHIRHTSFDASDLTLVNANHMDNFRSLFFSDKPTNILDLNKNFQPWANELYSCNMWVDMDLKQLVNPYYTDNMVNNLAQSTHQLRNNIAAVHDLGTIVNNRYMNTEYILRATGILNTTEDIASQRAKIIQQIKGTDEHLCKLVIDKANHYKLVDYTPRLLKADTDDIFFENILKDTILLDEGMMRELSDWGKSTSIALKMQASNAPEWLSNAYNIYKKTIRSATITMYLYGNLGTAVRNLVDSSTKGANETMQYNQDMLTYLKKYKDAVADVHQYSNAYREIEDTFGTVNRETIAKYFEGNAEGLNKFNILYGYEHICGGDSLLQELSVKEVRSKNVDYIQEGLNIDRDSAERVRKVFDGVYSSPKYYGMTNAQLEKHMTEIYDKCRKALDKEFEYDKITKNYAHGRYSKADVDAIMDKFWDYHPTVLTWGDKMTEFPILGFNKARFNNAETRARLAVYQTFLEGGSSEVEAMKHVTTTQFHYAGLGKVEDFMPFTQYKLYNALYWFDHASSRAASTAWRAAQYNGDGAKTNQEISDMIAKYRQRSYYIYDAGKDEAYDNYFQNVLEPSLDNLFDAGSYLGVPREYGVGNIDVEGTHYLKLGNSFIEEVDLVATCMASAAIFASTMKANFNKDNTANTADRIRMSYQSLRFTPLYDSFYSPWKSYADLVAYTYDHYRLIDKDHKITSKDIAECYKLYAGDKSTKSLALSGIPVAGAVLANMATRWKSFELNAGLFAALSIDPDAQKELFTYARDMLCDITGMFIPSVVGTKVEPDTGDKYNYYRDTLTKILIEHPESYYDFIGRLQRSDMGFTEEQAKEIMGSLMYKSPHSDLSNFIWLGDRSKQGYYNLISELYGNGYDAEEIINLFKQHNLPEKEIHRFMALSNALPDFLKYDKEKRAEIIAYYKAMGFSSDQAWAKLINNPAIIEGGRVRELTIRETRELNRRQNLTYIATKKRENLTQEEWDAYWDTLRASGIYYPKGKWSEVNKYLRNAGYTPEEARKMLLHGYMLDENGMLVDVPGRARTYAHSYSRMKDAEWDAYWNTVPDYTKYEKGAFGRTMKVLKKMGYNDEQARALIQQGLYANKDGTLMNVTGMERPVLGFPSFNAYYQSIPEYCRYEKGAFKRTYAALKALGFDYETSLRLIQQGAYLMDMSMAPSLFQTLGARRNKDGSAITVVDLNTLLARYGGQAIIGADGKPYMLVDCSGLTRPRKTYSYSRRGRGGGRSGRSYSKGGRGKRFRGYGGRGGRREYTPKPPKVKQFKLRKPFLLNGNVSTFSGMTNFRGSNKLEKPYATKGYVSTYSAQNFLNGSSYGMRKTYKIDMRQFKSGALSTKSAYPTSYRNIAVAYRRNMYKDLYAKYGMSRMRMRANKQGYSNAAITRLRRNEIQNRERYDERRDQITKTRIKKKASN